MLIINKCESTDSYPNQERIKNLSLNRWPEWKINDWYSSQGWLCGFNFLPSSAVNFIEMWNDDSFDSETIDRELGWARDVGFNSLRTNIPFTVWQDGEERLLARIEEFIDIADRNGLKTVFCLFDDCGFSGDAPQAGVQPEPVPGVHNSRAIASPGREKVIDHQCWPELERYTRCILDAFKSDDRILFWDLYNEPGNLMIFNEHGQCESDPKLEPASLDLVISVFEWSRNVGVSQPLTVGAWHVPMPWEKENSVFFDHDIDRVAFEISDIISFHCYCPKDQMLTAIGILEAFGRPVMCTEWMARTVGSRIEDQLPLMHQHHVGAWQWGLVQGKTQTHIPWPAVKESMENYQEGQSEWFHDLLYPDGRAYDAEEISLIKSLTQKNK